ncbi:MAG: threonine--tRNA ligase, partial [Planctomycetales bacterium]|nr:threonine--tRNA ligase [Planctomycetales bacterium]
SAAHVMARAVMRLFDGVQLAFGPTIEGGFYYDFDCEQPLTEEMFPAIEAEMRKIVQADEPFERLEESRDRSLAICRDLDQRYKVEHIETGLAEHSTMSFYRQGEFLDLCRGPHVPSAGAIGAFKLLSIAGAYWKGDAANKQLQRLYATAFFTQQDLDEHLKQLEEAKRRDHRVLGKQHDLFAINNLVGQGLILWQPKGAVVRNTLESFVRDELRRRGYDGVYTPNVGRVELYETSGHFPYYRDSQFPPIFDHEAGQLIDALTQRLVAEAIGKDEERKLIEAANVLGAGLNKYDLDMTRDQRLAMLNTWAHEHERYLLKPMNCPHHVQVFANKPRSYRELPVR